LNLLKETRVAIKTSGYTVSDIVFIGSPESGHECTWEQFESLANWDYDSSWGAAKVATDLIVVFSDGQQMWRGEYDGSEWWELRTPFVRPRDPRPIMSLFASQERTGWLTLKEINEPEQEWGD
jgi:hypothetical protein